MEEEKKLYPFRFCADEERYGWGSEEFRLADLGYKDTLVRDGWLAGNSISEIMDMYCDRVTGETVFGFYGRQFPLQVKSIKVNGRMPLRVHPDDATAIDRYDFLGKEKMWYVVEASSDACLHLGFKKDCDAGQLYQACLDNSVDGLLNTVRVKAGDHFHIKPGTVHAASGKMKLLEISQSSPMDFCLCGWGEDVSENEFDTSLNLVDALDFIDYAAFVNDAAEGDLLATVPQFTARRISLTAPLLIHPEDSDSFAVYSCVKGSALVGGQLVSEDETVLVPAECQDFKLEPQTPGTVLVETYIEHINVADAYINQDAAPTLPEDE